MAVLIPCLVKIRSQVDALNPKRDKASDGWIGNPAHAASTSSHNPDETGKVPIRDTDTVDEVHALDIDETGPWPSDARGPWTLMRMVRQLVADCRAGREKRLRYIIYERTIWSASWGWTAREYTGANPHDKHCHLDGSYDSAQERDTRPWNIGFVEDDMSAADVAAIKAHIDAQVLRAVHAIITGTGNALVNDTVHTWMRQAPGLIDLGAAVDVIDDKTAVEIRAASAAQIAAIEDVPTLTVEAFGASDSPEVIADRLKAALGDKAAAVGAILAQG